MTDRVGVELCGLLDASLRDASLATPLHAALADVLPLLFTFLSSPDVAVGDAVVEFASEYVTRLRRVPALLASHGESARLLLRLVAARLRFPDQLMEKR